MAADLQRPRTTPRATYRLQFNEHFRLPDALALAPYLHDLGISHIYASPLFQAAPHSLHGYDVRNFQVLNPELGTDGDLENLVAALHERGMGLVLDIVPNHMSIGGQDNQWWWDVLKFGAASKFAGYFDIDWQSADPELRGKVLLPVLGDDCPRLIERGELRIEERDGEFCLRYFEHSFPVSPASLPEKLFLLQSRPAASVSLAAALQRLNVDAPALCRLIGQQHYVLAPASEGDGRLNYRRFFNVADLAGLRMEDEVVFQATHQLLVKWIGKGWLDGFRVDHPDGLRDPGQYLDRLRKLAPGIWIVAEKILQADETIPAGWPIAGTTGYDFLNQVAALFVNPESEPAFTEFYAGFTGEPTDYDLIATDKKRLVLSEMFETEMNRLTALLVQVAAQHWRFEKITEAQFREALLEFAASLPVYRTYIQVEKYRVEKDDAGRIEFAAKMARQWRPDLDPELFTLIRDLLSLPGDSQSEFVARFQQLTGPATAKGVEDTACYCFNRLISLNEVGGNPGRFGTTVNAFHVASRQWQEHWPDAMLATSSHDTKRSEDIRARISVLSEMPQQWFEAARRWSAMNEGRRKNGLPDRNAEYFFYQTLVGAWPLSVERALACMDKASREAKQHTAWNNPNLEYDQALQSFVTTCFDDPTFMGDVEEFVKPVIEAGYVNSLAQTLIKLTAPGVPDFYQGCELWDLSLVDPDNRRPVDFEIRSRLLEQAKTLAAEEIWQRRESGLPKLWLIRQTLALRRQVPDLYAGGSSYELLPVEGKKAGHVVAFIRGGKVATVVPRLVIELNGDWDETKIRLPHGVWRNELGGGEVVGGAVPVAALLEKFPVALLVRKESA